MRVLLAAAMLLISVQRAEAVERIDELVLLDVVTQTGTQYAGWHLDVPDGGAVLARMAGAGTEAGSLAVWVIARASTAGGGARPQFGYEIGSDGERIGTPGIAYTFGSGSHVPPGEYLVVAGLTGEDVTAAAIELRGPGGASIRSRFTGPLWGFADGDFSDGGHAVVGPGVDLRSLHGEVSIDVESSLFATVRTPTSAESGVTIVAPDGTATTDRLVVHGAPGRWTFRLDVERDETGTIDSFRDHRTYIDAFDVPLALLAATATPTATATDPA